jgi:hypothetical protein
MEIWPDCGYVHLSINAKGWLVPGANYWRLLLQRPELAPMDESGPAERTLHARLVDDPSLEVSPQELSALWKMPIRRKTTGISWIFAKA